MFATSRAPLRLRAERVFEVEPLSLPAAPGRAAALESPSVTLFIRLARDTGVDLAATDADLALVVDLCRQLDGLPLALELAADRLKLLSPGALVRRLERRLPLLTGGARDLPARQQTLRATIAWSYDLLSSAEQQLFRRLAVFAGGSTPPAVNAVCLDVPDPEIVVLDRLSSLVDQHLLRQAPAADGEPRFLMLETIREFGEEQLLATGELEAIRERHANFFLALAEDAEPELRMGEQVNWLERIDDEHDNLRVAIDGFRRNPQGNRGARLAGDLWFYWMVRGHHTEGRQHLNAALQLLGAGPIEPLEARAVFGAGWLAAQQGDHDVARDRYAQLELIHQATGDAWSSAYVAIGLGQSAVRSGDDVGGQQLLLRGLELANALGDRWVAGWIRVFLAPSLIRQGELTRAQALLEESVIIRRDLGDQHGLAASLAALALVALHRHDLHKAQALARQGLDLSRVLMTAPTWPPGSSSAAPLRWTCRTFPRRRHTSRRR